uniref:GRB10 interacting GYF protein 1 n=1 Tax=Lates calcarifer TaxID=8187 RepID=A0A4W6EBM0_LATCA
MLLDIFLQFRLKQFYYSYTKAHSIFSLLCANRGIYTKLFIRTALFSHRLRALSSGGSVTSPPPSPAMPKYKLAEYRYGREEMLALYIKDNKVPEDMQDKEFAAILQDEPMQPLALVPLTEEEQKNAPPMHTLEEKKL